MPDRRGSRRAAKALVNEERQVVRFLVVHHVVPESLPRDHSITGSDYLVQNWREIAVADHYAIIHGCLDHLARMRAAIEAGLDDLESASEVANESSRPARRGTVTNTVPVIRARQGYVHLGTPGALGKLVDLVLDHLRAIPKVEGAEDDVALLFEATFRPQA